MTETHEEAAKTMYEEMMLTAHRMTQSWEGTSEAVRERWRIAAAKVAAKGQQ